MEANTEELQVYQGEIKCGEGNDWYVESEGRFYGLHPDDLEYIASMEKIFDNISDRILASPNVEFSIIEHQKMDGVIKYAKLL